MSTQTSNKFNKFRKGVLKGRIRRSLLVVFLGTLLTIFFLFFIKKQNNTHLSSSRSRSSVLGEVLARSEGPRIVNFVISDKIDETLCYSVGSAYLNGLTVVMAGYKMKYRIFSSKFDFMEAAIRNTELQPDDVIIVMDSGTFLTGVDFNPLLDRFIAHSPATPEKLDALAVRQGRAMAPFLISSNSKCLQATVLEHWGGCESVYDNAYEKVRKYAAAHPEHNLDLSFDVSQNRYLFSGVVVARVWAYKEFLKRANNYVNTQILQTMSQRRWLVDQSIYIAIFLDLIAWEVEQGVLSMSINEQRMAKSSYGIRAGLLGLDYTNALLVVDINGFPDRCELHDEQWTRYLPADGSKFSHSHSITRFNAVSRFVVKLYRRAYSAHGDGIYSKLVLPRWFGRKEVPETTNITLTPPLLAFKQNSKDAAGSKGRTYPAFFHTGGLEQIQVSEGDMKLAICSIQWFVPMAFDLIAKRQAMRYLASVPLFLSTQNSIIRDSYREKCGFPFEKAIEKIQSR